MSSSAAPETAPANPDPTAQRRIAVAGHALHKRYGEDATAVDALRDVSVQFEAGSFTAIMGPSGSGKSTLLHILAGLEEPSDGWVEVAGTRLDELSDHDLTLLRRDQVGFVFQSYNLLPVLTAEENITLPLDIGGTEVDREWLDTLIRTMGIEARREHRPNEMSGGEQQRVAVARAFVNRPMILIADEPTGNLDPNTSVGIMKLLDRINRTGTTVLMATHDAGIVDQMRKRVIELQAGKVIRDQARGVYGYQT
jgi:cell division transport system ATP-binding protein